MNTKLNGITLALCQMNVIPGRPDLNARYIAGEIEEAAKRTVDIIVLPELSTTGYFIGDMFEDEAFMHYVEIFNRVIRDATRAGIVAIVGTPVGVRNKTGEDGRMRVTNAGVVYAHGRYVDHVAKTLQPNYRMFDDDRHFFSTRKKALEEGRRPQALLRPIALSVRGIEIQLGLMLCEDMWHEAYAMNPARILAARGADMIVNISASPWTWQKNRKRHAIVKTLAGFTHLPLVYVNNTGAQNTGKNIIIFDGASTVYDERGEPVFEVPSYTEGTHDVTIGEGMKPVVPSAPDDTRELYRAARTAIAEFFAGLPPDRRKVVIGVSGGIDSALATALYTDILGADNVYGINMPTQFNSADSQAVARTVAENLGISYEVRPIQKIVDAIADATGVQKNTLAYENIQARSRMEVLAARAQDIGGVFSDNWNKVEAAFGYGTLYGDMAGALAPIGDLVKREGYQLADFFNRGGFCLPHISKDCFDTAPSAELSSDQKDPFDYGRIESRGYHEEMVRAFTEFRRNPEWFLEKYGAGLLEQELMLPAGRLRTLFPTARHFIHDLEKHWRLYHWAYLKRLQGPPIPIVSKRAFGTDLRETLVSAHLTSRYAELRTGLLAKEPERLVVYGGGFNPPAVHHRRIVQQLLDWFCRVAVVPSGNRERKDSLLLVSPADRKEMTMRNFADLPNVVLDTSDLDEGVFTPAWALDEKYKAVYPGVEIWHAVGAEAVAGGAEGKAEIQRLWKKGPEIWRELNFVVISRPGFRVSAADLPPKNEAVEIENFFGARSEE